jgi:corrinoid protein of di/trimethylamine methyltransferase
VTHTDDDILRDLAEAVLDMDETRAADLAHEAIATGLDAYTAVQQGLVPGMERAGELFESQEYFVPELLLCSDAMYAGLGILQPHLTTDDTSSARAGIVIGVVEGDTHDIGKNLVAMMLEVAGFEVHDLGRDVPLERFVDRALETDARLICLSTLMTTTLDSMGDLVRLLEVRGVRERFAVLVGGGPVTPSFARHIGADGYGVNASKAVEAARELCGVAV